MSVPEALTWKIGGVGGYGLQIASNWLGRAFVRGGLFAHVYDEFPSVIKGGASAGQVTVSASPLRSHRAAVNLLVCLNERSIVAHSPELVSGGWLVYDSDEVPTPPKLRTDIVALPVPFMAIIREIKGEKIMRNVVSLGATLTLLDYPTEFVKDIIKNEYGQRGGGTVALNEAALERGAQYVREHQPKPFPITIAPQHRARNRMLIPGNEAMGIGAVAAGLRFYAGYPMTPSSSILMFMAKHGPANGMVVRQLPDEMAVINAAIGASFAGVRAMVATSGGGFALMVESLGLAAMTETPLVVVDAQRPGPSTGLPTWTEQADLRFVLHAAQGDFPRIVLAPGDVGECFSLMPLAFNIADRYQTPVTVLTDKYLGESWFTTEPFPTKDVTIDRGEIVSRPKKGLVKDFYPRYLDTASGVSPRPLPGTPDAPFLANSDEHDVYGLSNEQATVRITQHAKRMKKLVGISKELPEPVLYGPKRADLTVCAWGSTKGPMLDALDLLTAEGERVNFLYTPVLMPFPTKPFISALKAARRLVIVEGNATGQFAGLMREHTGIAVDDRVLRFDGRPFEAIELAKLLRERSG